MRYLPPVPLWSVEPGTVVLDATGTPRTVVGNVPEDRGTNLLLLEGDPRPHYYADSTMVTPVVLDDTDAIGTLFAAGLNPTPIGE